MTLVATDAEEARPLVITVGVDFHRENGILLPPHRSNLDRWAVEISEGARLLGKGAHNRCQVRRFRRIERKIV